MVTELQRPSNRLTYPLHTSDLLRERTKLDKYELSFEIPCILAKAGKQLKTLYGEHLAHVIYGKSGKSSEVHHVLNFGHP